MARVLVKGAEAALPTTTGAGVSFSYATNVRLVNTAAAGTNHLVTITAGTGGTVVGSLTVLGGTAEIIEKQPTQTIFAANAAVKGSAVAYGS